MGFAKKAGDPEEYLQVTPSAWVSGDFPAEGIFRVTQAKLDKYEVPEAKDSGDGDNAAEEAEAQKAEAEKYKEWMTGVVESYYKGMRLGPPREEVKFFWPAADFTEKSSSRWMRQEMRHPNGEEESDEENGKKKKKHGRHHHKKHHKKHGGHHEDPAGEGPDDDPDDTAAADPDTELADGPAPEESDAPTATGV